MERSEYYAKLLSARRERLAVVERMGAQTKVSPAIFRKLADANYQLAVGLGYMILFGLKIDDLPDDGADQLDSAGAVMACRRVREYAAGGTNTVTNLLLLFRAAKMQPSSVNLLELLRLRMDLWAAMIAAQNADRKPLVKADIRDLDDALGDADAHVSIFDEMMQRKRVLFIPLIGNEVLYHWRGMLADEYKENPWWFSLNIQ